MTNIKLISQSQVDSPFKTLHCTIKHSKRIVMNKVDNEVKFYRGQFMMLPIEYILVLYFLDINFISDWHPPIVVEWQVMSPHVELPQLRIRVELEPTAIMSNILLWWFIKTYYNVWHSKWNCGVEYPETMGIASKNISLMINWYPYE